MWVMTGPSLISTLFANVGEGGGVCSIALESAPASNDRLRRLLGWESGECDLELEAGGDFGELDEVDGRAVALEAAAEAARAAFVMGTWIPRLGKDKDFRLVL